MVKRITVQGIRRQEPDVRRFVLALIELARPAIEPIPEHPTNEPPAEPASDEVDSAAPRKPKH
jgi:hypothetical protein